MEPKWRQTEQFKKLDYFRVEVGNARLISVRSEWPEELRWVFDLFIASPKAAGIKANYTPRFIGAVKSQNRLLRTETGNDGWHGKFRPWLDRKFGSA